MKTLSIAVVAMIAGLAVPPASADQFGCDPASYTVVNAGNAAYLDLRELVGVYPNTGKYIFSIWIYLESGGNPADLDRGMDASIVDPTDVDSQCGAGLLPPDVDSIIF